MGTSMVTGADIRATTGSMTTEATSDLSLLMTWLSPAFPVGGFSYSHALEAFVEAGRVTDAAATGRYVETVLTEGTGWSDAVLLAATWYAVTGAVGAPPLGEVIELAGALRGTRELALESLAQGEAFARTVGAAWPHLAPERPASTVGAKLAYPVAVALAAAAAGLPLHATITAYLQAQASALVSAAVRLIPLGQTDGQRVMASVLPTVEAVAARAAAATLDDVGGTAVAIDILSMKHETQYTRLFRS